MTKETFTFLLKGNVGSFLALERLETFIAELEEQAAKNHWKEILNDIPRVKKDLENLNKNLVAAEQVFKEVLATLDKNGG